MMFHPAWLFVFHGVCEASCIINYHHNKLCLVQITNDDFKSGKTNFNFTKTTLFAVGVLVENRKMDFCISFLINPEHFKYNVCTCMPYRRLGKLKQVLPTYLMGVLLLFSPSDWHSASRVSFSKLGFPSFILPSFLHFVSLTRFFFTHYFSPPHTRMVLNIQFKHLPICFHSASFPQRQLYLLSSPQFSLLTSA